MKSPTKIIPEQWFKAARESVGYKDIPISIDPDWMDFEKSTGFMKGNLRYSHLTRKELDDESMRRFLSYILLSDEEHKILNDFYFGIYSTYDYRARMVNKENGHSYIAIHNGLIGTIMLFSALEVFQAEPDKYELFNKDSTMLAYLSNIGSFWTECLNEFSFEEFEFPDLDEHSWELSQQLTNSAMTFILGHEIGHVLAGTHPYTDDKEKNYDMEYAADEWGVRMCVRHILYNGSRIPKKFMPIMLLGPYFAICTIAAIRDKPGKTHPSATMRLQRVSDYYQKCFREHLGRDMMKLYVRELGYNPFPKIKKMAETMLKRYRAYGNIINDIDQILYFKKPE
jgi:hypothetical protein